MKDFTSAIDQIFTKVGAAAGVAACWLFFQVQELNDKVEKLEAKTEAITEIKTDLASIKASVDLILKYNLKENKNVRTD